MHKREIKYKVQAKPVEFLQGISQRNVIYIVTICNLVFAASQLAAAAAVAVVFFLVRILGRTAFDLIRSDTVLCAIARIAGEADD